MRHLGFVASAIARESFDGVRAALAERPLHERAVRGLLAVPLLGWIAREVVNDPDRAAPLAAANVLMAWLLAFAVFGLAALVVPAMAITVVMFITFIAFGTMSAPAEAPVPAQASRSRA